MRSADFVEDVKDSNQKQERQFIVKNEKSKTKEAGCITRSRIQWCEGFEVCKPLDVWRQKNIAYTIFYSALEIAKSKLPNEEKSALEIWKKALENITPQVEVKSRRVGGATFQVPTEIRPDRKESISMKNLIIYSRKRGGKTMADKLAAEIVDAFNEQGGAFKRKEDMHKMAEANRAFAHFRF